MADVDPFLEINMGRRGSSLPVVIFGRNIDIDTGSVPEDVIVQGGSYQGFLATVAEVLDIVSTDAGDADAGIGAHDVIVFGLDDNYVEISETVTLNGVTPVSTVKSYLRVNGFTADVVGSNERNTGIITLIQTSSGHKMAEISVGAGIAHQAVCTVPADKAFIPKSLNIILNGLLAGTTAIAVVEARQPGKTWKQFFITGLSQGGGGYNLDTHITRVLKEKSDIKVTVLDVSSSNTDISARLTGVSVDKTTIKLPEVMF